MASPAADHGAEAPVPCAQGEQTQPDESAIKASDPSAAGEGAAAAADEAAEGDEAEDCEDGEDDEDGEKPSKKSMKRKRRAEAKDWKRQQRQKEKAARKNKPQPNSRKVRMENMRDSQKEEAAAEGAQNDETAPTEVVKGKARKAAELADFRARCEKGTTVVIDLEWEEDMRDKEIKSLVQQLLYCYGLNRSARKPVRLVLSGLAPETTTFQKLSKMAGFDGWPMEKLDGPYIDRFKREELVYLTADADEVLQRFEPDKVYIIGGIVDHNRLKGCTLDKARSQGIATAQLPLNEHIEMGAFSRVLAVNHVMQMVVEHQVTGDWRQVFEKCVPGRKHFLQPAAGADAEKAEATETVAAAPAAPTQPAAGDVETSSEHGDAAAPDGGVGGSGEGRTAPASG